MATAKLNVQHHYITAKIEWSKNLRVNMTASHSGSKISAVGVDNVLLKRIFKAFNHMLDKQVGTAPHIKNFGVAMDYIRTVGEASSSPEQLATVLEGLMNAFNSAPREQIVPTAVAATNLIIEEAPKKGSGRDYTQEELQAAFDRVKNAKNWKARIDRTIDIKDLDVTLRAIMHFTGTIAQEYSHPNPNKVIVRAKGYSAGGFD